MTDKNETFNFNFLNSQDYNYPINFKGSQRMLNGASTGAGSREFDKTVYLGGSVLKTNLMRENMKKSLRT